MAFVKLLNIKRGKKPSLVSRITDVNSGVGNKVMIKTGNTLKADSGDQTVVGTNKVSEISYSFNPGTATDENGDANSIVFSWCSDALGSNPITFFVAGGFRNGTKQIKFPVPLESPYASSNISVHGVGTQVCAGRSCSEKSTYTATTEIKMTT
jgi:hypothetical protein